MTADDASSHAMGQALGCPVSLRQNKPWRWDPVRTSIWSCLWRKLSAARKCCFTKSL